MKFNDTFCCNTRRLVKEHVIIDKYIADIYVCKRHGRVFAQIYDTNNNYLGIKELIDIKQVMEYI